MSDERQPVDENEFVYRRIHRSHYQAGLPIPVQMTAFRPNERDTTGISVFRERFVTPAETLANVNANRRADYYVARLSVRDLRRLGLNVRPEPNPNGPAGHAVIPETNWQSYEANRPRLKEILFQLAQLAGADMVHQAR